MIDIDFDDRGSDTLKALTALFGNAGTRYVLNRAAKVAGVAMESVVPAYPPASGSPLPVVYARQVEAEKPYRPGKGQPKRVPGQTYQSKFKSMRQQKAVFAKIQDGDVPYKRTGTLGKSITSSVDEVDNDRAVVSIGSNVPYAPLVKGGEDEQVTYHAGNWTSLEDDLTAGVDTITEKTLNELERAAVDFINGKR